MNAITRLESDAPLCAQDNAFTKGERLTFRLGAEGYGIDILRVLNLRRVIVPIVNLLLKFGFAHVVYDGGHRHRGPQRRRQGGGAVVDSISDVIELTDDQSKPAPEFSSVVDTGYIVGIGVVKQDEPECTLTYQPEIVGCIQ